METTFEDKDIYKDFNFHFGVALEKQRNRAKRKYFQCKRKVLFFIVSMSVFENKT